MHERNQKAHSNTGELTCARGSSSTPLLSSSSGIPGKWLAKPVLMEVSVMVVSVAVKPEQRDGGCVDGW